ncbi:MAG: hypothetical protein Q8P15_04195 [Nanoarchaeota archaeon]|nr:hypothetical protein [Nanoarchaeota archaeon]
MKKKVVVGLFFLSIIILSVSMVSAYSFSDYWNKLTGKATDSYGKNICSNYYGNPVEGGYWSTDALGNFSSKKLVACDDFTSVCLGEQYVMANGKCFGEDSSNYRGVYDTGGFQDGNDKIAIAYTFSNSAGKWIDCDTAEKHCGLCGGENSFSETAYVRSQISGCEGKDCWTQSVQENVGEYSSIESWGCCGDDANEYLNSEGKCVSTNVAEEGIKGLSSLLNENITGYTLMDSYPRTESDCDNLADEPELGLEGEFCVDGFRLEYWDSKQTKSFHVILSKVTSGQEFLEQYFSLDVIPSFVLESYTFFKPENHELTWFSSNYYFNLITVQEYDISVEGNSVSYDLISNNGDNAVTQKILELYPVDMVKMNKILGGSGTVPLVNCTDSDGGRNIYEKGYVTLNGQRFDDYCSYDFENNPEGVLQEFKCSDKGTLGQEGITCENGCLDGACVNASLIENETLDCVSGCLINSEKCIPFGNRMVINGTASYCDIDGVVKQQKTKDSEGWAKCQNNYECDSNVCSSGECIEVATLLQEASTFKRMAVSLWCAFAHPLSEDERNLCKASLLGA